jgi:hypothetical protein
VIGIVLEPTERRIEHRVDYLGSILLAGAVVTFLLAMVWGGDRYAWTSATIFWLLILSVALMAAFFVQERRASEPVIALRLLRLGAVSVSALYAFSLSLVVFGGTIIPIQQMIQVVIGAKASDVWRYMTPFAILNVVAAVAAGRLIARYGRYRAFPVAASLGVLGTMLLMATVDVDTSGTTVALYLGLLGLSMGFGAVVPVLAAQNAVERDDLGVVSGVVNFFQQLGGSVGTAIFGTIFAKRLSPRIADLVESGAASADQVAGPEAIRELEAPTRDLVREEYVGALEGVYTWTALAALVAIALALAIREAPLKSWSYAARDLQGEASEETLPG